MPWQLLLKWECAYSHYWKFVQDNGPDYSMVPGPMYDPVKALQHGPDAGEEIIRVIKDMREYEMQLQADSSPLYF